MTVRVSQKGWVVIPAELRKKYHLEPGAEVVFVDYGGGLAIFPALKDPVNQAAGMLRDSGRQGGASLTEVLLKERREDILREERKRS